MRFLVCYAHLTWFCVFLSLLLPLTGSCGNRVRDSEPFLRGGSALPIADPLLKHLVRLEKVDGSVCSGVLVRASLILTAAHCLPAVAGEDLELKLPEADGTLRKGPRPEAYGRFWDQDGAFFPNFDLAWIRLSEAVPGLDSDLSVLADPELLNGSSLRLLSFDVSQARELSFDFLKYVNSPHLFSIMTLKAQAGSGTEGGDSGSASFLWDEGHWLLVGITNGKHPILTPNAYPQNGEPSKSSEVLQTFVADYLPWIMKSSGLEISSRHSRRTSEALVLRAPQPYTSTPTSWTAWFSQSDFRQATWVTVHKLLEQLYIQGIKSGVKAPWSELFSDPAVSSALLPTIESLPETVMGLASQRVAIEDLRPLSSLPKLKFLRLEDRPYRGLEQLSRLPQLEKLEVKARFSSRPSTAALGLERIRSSSLKELDLQGLALRELTSIDWSELDQLRVLRLKGARGEGLPSSALGFLSSLELEELSLDNWYCDDGALRLNPSGSLKVLDLGQELRDANHGPQRDRTGSSGSTASSCFSL